MELYIIMAIIVLLTLLLMCNNYATGKDERMNESDLYKKFKKDVERGKQ